MQRKRLNLGLGYRFTGTKLIKHNWGAVNQKYNFFSSILVLKPQFLDILNFVAVVSQLHRKDR